MNYHTIYMNISGKKNMGLTILNTEILFSGLEEKIRRKMAGSGAGLIRAILYLLTACPEIKK